jgi:hypothetical protein
MEWKIAVQLLSDTTFSRGEPTAGEVDTEIEHDDLGLPRFGGKALRSILRDSWLAMARHFPDLEPAAVAVFGPVADFDETSILHIGDAVLPQEVSDVVRFAIEDQKERDARLSPMDVLRSLSDIRFQTAEERQSGAPARATLRSTRVWLHGIELFADIRWLREPGQQELQCLALALLASRHVGLARNRGRGHVRLTLVRPGAGGTALDDTLALAKGTATLIRQSPARDPAHNTSLSNAPQQPYLRFTIELTSRAVLTGTGGDPNSAATLPYIPGSSVRGIIASRIDPATDPDLFERLILSDEVAYLNAYPVAGGVRALPMPVSWRREKHGDEVHDLASYDLSGERLESQLGGTAGSFVTLGADRMNVGVRQSAQIHDQRDRELGRAWKKKTPTGEEGKGTIYVYESLDARQRFSGFIVAGSDDGRRIRDLLPDGTKVSLGRSRRAGYGGEGIFRWEDDTAQEARTDDALPGPVAQETVFRILLTSPYIGRDQLTGQIDPASLDDELRRLLDVEIVGRRWSIDRTASYNRTWRLKVPEAFVIQAGSVILVKARSKIEQTTLQRIMDGGIGERRNEGFGRILFLQAPVAKEIFLRDTPADGPALLRTRPLVGDQKARQVIEEMQTRIMAERARSSIDTAVAVIATRPQRLPSRSLLGRLLLPLLREPERGVTSLEGLIAESGPRLRRKAIDHLESCRVAAECPQLGKRNLRSALNELCERPFLDDERTPSLQELVRSRELIAQCELVDEATARRLFKAQEARLRFRLLTGVLSSLRSATFQPKQGAE